MKQMLVKIKDHGLITIELFEDIAPLTIKNITRLSLKGSYDNRVIERLEPDFVIQPILFDTGDFAELMEPEFKMVKANGEVKYVRGIVGMGGVEDASSIGQFFITLRKEAPHLNGGYTVIGQVVDGWDEVERIEKLKVVEMVDPESGTIYHKPQEDAFVEYVKIVER